MSSKCSNSSVQGVVPEGCLKHIAIGWEKEIGTLLQDLKNIAEGGCSIPFHCGGRYGFGKSFMLQLGFCNHHGTRVCRRRCWFVSARRMVGQKVRRATYRELMQNISTKLSVTVEPYTDPEGCGLMVSSEPSRSRYRCVQTTTVLMTKWNRGILAAVKNMEGLVSFGFFATVVTTYWRGYRLDDDDKKCSGAALLRGEFGNRATE